MDFYKYHGLGNDYIVMDPAKTKIKMTDKNIKLICDRNFGAGSDGILYGPFFEEGGMPSLKIFNPDASEAEKSGNGIRIFAKYLIDAGYIKNKVFKIKTKGGIVTVEKLKDDGTLLKVDMGKVTFVANKIPVNNPSNPDAEFVKQELDLANLGKYTVTCLSIGNPHCVIPMTEISAEKAKQIGHSVETHKIFPNKINMQLLKVIDRKNIQIEIWERGAGYTLASGSSSCAAATAAYKLGLVDNNVTVHMPGGILAIEILKDYEIRMTGPVASVFEGNFTKAFIDELD